MVRRRSIVEGLAGLGNKGAFHHANNGKYDQARRGFMNIIESKQVDQKIALSVYQGNR